MKRKFVAIAPIKVVDDKGGAYVGAMAVADDGTAWNLLYETTYPGGWRWAKMLELPDTETTP